MNTYVELVPTVLRDVDVERHQLPNHVEGAAADADDKVGERHTRLRARVHQCPDEYRTEQAQNRFDVRAEEECGRLDACLDVVLFVLLFGER